jgi:DNA-binding transcriptional LysR family regulator
VELRHIRYFLTVAEEGNFTRAAQKLGMSQPPLSSQIKALEEELGAQLFHRIPQGAELTIAGKVLRDRIAAIPDLIEAALRDTRRAAKGETGSVRLGFTGSAAFNHRVPNSIRTFRRKFPEVELSLSEDNSQGLVTALLTGTLDVAFIRPTSVDHTGLRIYPLEEEPLIVALPSARVPPSDPVRLIDLAQEPLIVTPRSLGPTLFDETLALCRKAGFEPVQGQSAPQVASVLALVAAELGFALVPDSMRDTALRGVSYYALEETASVTLALALRSGEHAPAVLAFATESRFPDAP